MWFVFVLIFLSKVSAEKCDFRQRVELGKSYGVYSPAYPGYTGNVKCRWLASCPSGYNCKLDCPEIDLNKTIGCKSDYLLVSKSGDPRLAGAERYCGRGSLSVQSEGELLSIGLIASRRARFHCKLSAVPVDCQCGSIITHRIVGGREASEPYPFMAGLVDLMMHHLICGGTIIDHKQILTAAHCVANQRPENVLILIGITDISNVISLTSFGKKVKKFSIHPLYSPSSYDYDLAIVELAVSLKFGGGVRPACLPFQFKNSNITGKELTVLGWGTVFPGGPRSDVLLETTVKVISLVECRNTIPNITDNQFCTYSPGKDACQGDSGGPLVSIEDGKARVLGVVSYGHWCASDRPAVNMRLTAALGWIIGAAHIRYCRQ